MPLGGCGISGSFITSINEFSEGSGGGGLILIFLLSESQLTWGKAKNANSESYLKQFTSIRAIYTRKNIICLK